VSWAWLQGYEGGTTLLCCFAVSLDILVRRMIGNQMFVWEQRFLKYRQAEHRMRLGVMWIRGRDCEQLVPDVALSREGGLRWLPVLLLGLILCASCFLLVLFQAMADV
jgi:hypothetical protein